jgi:glucose/arabinose dehydrogenase
MQYPNFRKTHFRFALTLTLWIFVASAPVAVHARSPLASAALQSPATIELQLVLAGLSSPVLVTNAGDASNRLFIVEQSGKIKVLAQGATAPTVFIDLAAKLATGGERGLLGLAFHPQYATNRRFFVNYTRAGDGATVIAEYLASSSTPNVGDITSERVLLAIAQPFDNHNGGMIEFGNDGFLYIGTGDGGSSNDPGNRAQNIEQLLGKMLRIGVDPDTATGTPYTLPADNPFAGATPGRDEIYAVGLRNPFRWSFDRQTGTLWAGDVGQGQIEEIDTITRGGNYGWRVYEGTRCTGLGPAACVAENYVAPVTEYRHEAGRCSVTGGYVYRGTRGSLFPGAYIFGDFCTGEIFMFRNGAQTRLLDTPYNISSFGEDEAGEIYVAHIGGAIYRITNPTPPIALAPIADAYVKGATPTTNFGSVADLQVKRTLNPGSGKGRQAYLRFDTSSVTGEIKSATLRIFGRLNALTAANQNIPLAVFPVSTAWEENTLTWDNKPLPNQPEELTRTVVTDAVARWYELDITAFIQAERTAGRTLTGVLLRNMLRGEAGDFYSTFNSRETTTANAPQLVIQQ